MTRIGIYTTMGTDTLQYGKIIKEEGEVVTLKTLSSLRTLKRNASAIYVVEWTEEQLTEQVMKGV